MTTIAAGRLGGQYGISLVTDDTYRVHGHLFGNKHTIGSGSYTDMTKLMDYCVQHDGQAQEAIKLLHFDGDPTKMIDLHKAAQEDLVARPRKRVALIAFVETDVLESEDAITIVTERMSAALHLSGVTVTQLNVHYAEELIPSQMREQLSQIDSELGPVSEDAFMFEETRHHNLRLDDTAAPAVQTGAMPLITDPSDRDNVQQSPITRPNK